MRRSKFAAQTHFGCQIAAHKNATALMYSKYSVRVGTVLYYPEGGIICDEGGSTVVYPRQARVFDAYRYSHVAGVQADYHHS